MESYRITYEDETLSFKKCTIHAPTLASMEKLFQRNIGFKRITNIKVLE